MGMRNLVMIIVGVIASLFNITDNFWARLALLSLAS